MEEIASNPTPETPTKPVEAVEVEKLPKRLTTTNLRHKEVISRMVYHNQTVRQMAEELGFSESNLRSIINSPLFQIELQKELSIKQRMERDSVLQQIATSGAKKLLEAVEKGKMVFRDTDSEGREVIIEKVVDGREIVNIVHDALDRSGHKPVERSVSVTGDLGTLVMQAFKNKKDEDEAAAAEASNV